MSMKQEINLQIGSKIVGKWHDNHYVIQKKLGAGTVGTVYLCEKHGNRYALKISKQSSSMTVEVNVLKALRQVQGYRLGPSLIDVDDWQQSQGEVYAFYVMDYIAGERIDRFIKKNGSEWIGVLMLQLLGDLGQLHRLGWIFGDLKIEHLIVQPSPPRMCFMDVGGTTQMGRAVKEYTEFYDRGYWGLGTRRAEPGYDLFAFAMTFIAVFYPRLFAKSTNSSQVILNKLNSIHELKLYKSCLKKAILGKYISSTEMKQDIVQVLHDQRKKQLDKQKKQPVAIESGGILLLSIIYYLASLFY